MGGELRSVREWGTYGYEKEVGGKMKAWGRGGGGGGYEKGRDVRGGMVWMGRGNDAVARKGVVGIYGALGLMRIGRKRGERGDESFCFAGIDTNTDENKPRSRAFLVGSWSGSGLRRMESVSWIVLRCSMMVTAGND